MSGQKYVVSANPHIRSKDSIDRIMKDVLIALTPATFAGIYFFGIRAAAIIVLCVGSCIFFEWMSQRLMQRPVTISDYSAAVTGILLAMNMPASAPFWMSIVGSAFAIIIVKQIFGGLGQNFINPALAARAMLLASYPQAMTGEFTQPINGFFALTEAVTGPTPLAVLQESGLKPQMTDYLDAFIGATAGCLGETSALALIVGGIYLLYRKVINWRIPTTYIFTVLILSYILGRNGLMSGYPIYELLTGGLLLGAFFMATDYSTSPVTPNGQLIMGIGCGILTVVIRVYGGYPEGVSYSILLMNLTVPLLDRYTRPRVFGKRTAKQ